MGILNIAAVVLTVVATLTCANPNQKVRPLLESATISLLLPPTTTVGPQKPPWEVFPPNCEKQNFEGHMKKTCNTKYETHFSTKQSQSCSSDKDVQKFSNAFMMNMFSPYLDAFAFERMRSAFAFAFRTRTRTRTQDPAERRRYICFTITIWICYPRRKIRIRICIRWPFWKSGIQVSKKVITPCMAAQYAMCMFKQNNFYNRDGTINYDSVSAHFMSTSIKISPVWAYSLESAISSLNTTFSGVKEEYTTLECESEKVDMKPLVIMQAMQAVYLKTCPNPKSASEKYMADFELCTGSDEPE